MTTHLIQCDEIDELDEISGDQQLAYVWCVTCRKYESRWLPRSALYADMHIPFEDHDHAQR